jgi:hypothetical protein
MVETKQSGIGEPRRGEIMVGELEIKNKPHRGDKGRL